MTTRKIDPEKFALVDGEIWHYDPVHGPACPVWAGGDDELARLVELPANRRAIVRATWRRVTTDHHVLIDLGDR